MLALWENYGLLIQIFSVLFSISLLLGIIFFILKTRLLDDWFDNFIDIRGLDLSRRRSVKAWKQIQKRLRLGNENNLKLAFLEADKILEELLKMSGYKGETMDERLEKVGTAQISNIETLRQAHKLRHRLMTEPDYFLNQEQAEIAVSIYKQTFKEMGLLD